MQPTYLPWSGYLNLIASVDCFVMLDDVQFEHQSWQTRNRILLQGKEHMLVVPIQRSPLSTLIREIRVVETERWQSKHWKSLVAAYHKAADGQALLELLEPFYAQPASGHLADFNIAIIAALAQAVGIQTPIVRASTLARAGKRSSHLIEICQAIGCNEYLSPPGSREYLLADDFEMHSGIRLEFQDFQPRPYRQPGTDLFVSHLSFVDVIANLGVQGAATYVGAGA